MRNLIFLLGCILAVNGYGAFQMESVHITGEKEAHLDFLGTGTVPLPSQSIQDGIIELAFQGGEISANAQGKLDLESPHTLIRRVSVYSPEKGIVKAKIVINGTTENIKERFSYSRTDKGIQLVIAYPKTESAALGLLKEEQQPVKDLVPTTKADTSKIPYLQFLVVTLVLIAAAGSTIAVARTLGKRGGVRGSRKYLIEQLAHYGLGNKSGVSLLKVGGEFVLIGVTPENVSFLSSLPRLQEQYEDETRFERGAFREAVQEETSRMRVANA